jgi:hypothetical protein
MMNEGLNMIELTPFEQDMAKDRETFMTLLKGMLTDKEVKLLGAYIGNEKHAAGMVAELVAMTLRRQAGEG